VWFLVFDYNETKDLMLKEGIYLPQDQWILFGKLIDIQLDLDIGKRRKEWDNESR